MVDPKKKGKYIGMVGALLVHVAFILLLILVGFALPEQQDEDGMPVMLGEVPNAFGSADPSLVKVDVMPETVAPKVQETVEQEMLTQEDEETVVIKPKAEPKKEEVKKKPENRRRRKPRKRKKPGSWRKLKPSGNAGRRKRLPVRGWQVPSEKEHKWEAKVRLREQVSREVPPEMRRKVRRAEREVTELLTSAGVL